MVRRDLKGDYYGSLFLQRSLIFQSGSPDLLDNLVQWFYIDIRIDASFEEELGVLPLIIAHVFF
jgi:hypothetical protein